MKNRIFGSAAALTLALAAQAAVAGHDRGQGRDYGDGRGNDYGRDYGRDYDFARVINVRPLVEQVRYTVPVQQCWTESRYRDRPVALRGDSTGTAIIGGAVGAIIGHQIGRGESRPAATFGGAVVGAVLGHELARNSEGRSYREPRVQEVERCRTHHEERFDERVRGYQVTYVYNGQRGVTELPYDPGPRLRIAVRVHPLG